jgi:hypothetical protein
VSLVARHLEENKKAGEARRAEQAKVKEKLKKKD